MAAEGDVRVAKAIQLILNFEVDIYQNRSEGTDRKEVYDLESKKINAFHRFGISWVLMWW